MSSTETGNVQCILCSCHINFMQDGKDTFYKHLKSEHSILFSQDLIMAVNFLDIEITQQIVGNFDSQYTHIMNSHKSVVRKETTATIDCKENGEAMLEELIDSDDDVVFLEESNVTEENSKKNHMDNNAIETPDPKNKTSFVCTQCNETFESKSVLLTHINFHEMYRIQNAQKMVVEQNKSTPCTVISCNETFSEEVDLEKHKMSAHTELKKLILCTEISCNEKFSEESDLQKHTMYAHTKPKKSISCKEISCKETFSQESDLQKHTRDSHTDQNKLLSCTEISCNVTFSDEEDLQMHTMFAHTKQNKSISCTDISCTETFSEQSDFNEHILFAHKIIRSPITLKQKAEVENNLVSKNRLNLDQREMIKSQFKNVISTGHFPCPVCNKVFTSKKNQSSHTRKYCHKKTNLNKTVPTITKNNSPSRKNATKTTVLSSNAVKETSEQSTALDKKIVSSDNNIKRPKLKIKFISAGSSETVTGKNKDESKSEKDKRSTIIEPVTPQNNTKEQVASTDDEDIQTRKRPRRSCTLNTSYLK